MRILVVEFLKDAARKYFGSDSVIRNEVLPGIMERKALQKEAADQARTRRKKGLRQFLKEQTSPLDDALQKAKFLVSLASDTLEKRDRVQATVLAARVSAVKSLSETLRPPTPPAKLADLEDQWRSYRDRYQDLLDRLQDLSRLTAEVETALGQEAPSEVLTRRLAERKAAVENQLSAFAAAINERLGRLRAIWAEHRQTDGGELVRRVEHVVAANITTGNLLNYLNFIDANEAEISGNLAGKYRSFLNTLDQLIEGIDLEGAYAITEDDRSDLEEQLRDIRAVAQIGITVEIIGHEFETLEAEVTRNLQKLPAQVKTMEAYELALRSHLALADRLRFLSPLKIGGYRARETIRGEQIADYIGQFFALIFSSQRVDFTATAAFRSITFRDIPSRIYPVFINLVNNAVYWTSLAADRKITLDFQKNLAIIADSGPGVDPEDIPRLFELFFSRRRSGRGVGLYLSRVNLAVAGHKIRYAMPDDPKILGGAKFIIDFKECRRMLDGGYAAAVRETFETKPLRTVLMIDDEFPNLSDVIRGISDTKKFNQRDRAAVLYDGFRARNMICDVENDVHGLPTDRFRKSDLIILDYNLGPLDNDNEQSLRILRELANSKHFNTVIVYTADPKLDDVWLAVIASLSGDWSGLPGALEGDAQEHWERLNDVGTLPDVQLEAVKAYAERRDMRAIAPGDLEAARKELMELGVPRGAHSRIVETLIH